MQVKVEKKERVLAKETPSEKKIWTLISVNKINGTGFWGFGEIGRAHV